MMFFLPLFQSSASPINDNCKDVLPSYQINSVIYTFKFLCDTDYIDRIDQELDVRIGLHVPVKIPESQFDHVHQSI